MPDSSVDRTENLRIEETLPEEYVQKDEEEAEEDRLAPS